ncbi:hypothetical protein [Rhizomonospora bruguierae]|uniref:hypothetical protein n=1 Tax=Rhizomonospora bruguierae TaxID=1581705 RepID=UPI001BCE12CD|nr:hypothetical protein [Micromonospora sp. NBRC 107566]
MGIPEEYVKDRLNQIEQQKKDTLGKVKWEDFDRNTEYIERPGSHFEPPSGMQEYGGVNNKNHELAVSVEALEYFARQIEQILDKDMLQAARRSLATFVMRPGKFAKAEVLRQKIAGVKADDTGLRGDSMKLLQAVHDALYQIKKNLRELITNYDSTEEFNKLTTAQLDEVMGAAWGKIGSLGHYGQTEGSISGG